MYRAKKYAFLIIGVVALFCLLIFVQFIKKNEYINHIENIIVDCVKNNTLKKKLLIC